MSILPYKKYTLLTDLTGGEVTEMLSDQIEPADNWRYVSFTNSYSHLKPYEGRISGNKFKIRRIAYVNYKYPTIVRGTIIELENETAIEVAIWLNWFACFFMVIVLCLDVSIITMLIKEAVISGRTEPMPLYFFIGFMNTIGIVIPSYVFRLESAKAQNFLSMLLQEKNNQL